MDAMIAERKTQLRRAMSARRREVSPAELAAASRAVCHGLAVADVLRNAAGVMGYLAFRNEPAVDELLVFLGESRRSIFLPRVTADTVRLEVRRVENLSQCSAGYCGIREPDAQLCPLADLAKVGAVLVPGLAFDRRGNRLGNGKGHYDRLLPMLPKSCIFIGVCHDFQVVDAVPVDSGCDAPVHWLATPAGVAQCG